PPRPSTRLSHSGALPSIAAQRQMDPQKLTVLVRGELDWIVMKALEKNRGRRYETANGFALDVQRYLEGQPVLAAPASRIYRLRKFVRRNRGSVAAAGLVLLTLIGGIAGTTYGLIRAEERRVEADKAKAAESQRADGERKAKQEALTERDAKDKALIAEKKARENAMAALRAMTDEIVENQMARGTTLTDENKEFLRKIIKHFEDFAAITSDDAESRAIRAEGFPRVGRMRPRLGELKEAEVTYVDALAIWMQLAADFPTRSGFRQALAKSHIGFGNVLKNMGRLKEAETAYADAMSIQKQLAAEFPTRPDFRQELAMSHNNLGNLLVDTGRPKEAEVAYADALAIWKRLAADFPTHPEFRQDLAACQSNLGSLLPTTGRPKEPEAPSPHALPLP